MGLLRRCHSSRGTASCALTDGTITSVDVPGEGPGHGLDQGTVPLSINAWERSRGSTSPPALCYRGFVR